MNTVCLLAAFHSRLFLTSSAATTEPWKVLSSKGFSALSQRSCCSGQTKRNHVSLIFPFIIKIDEEVVFNQIDSFLHMNDESFMAFNRVPAHIVALKLLLQRFSIIFA